MYNVLTMTAAFQVILEAEEDDNRPRLIKPRVFSETGAFAFTIMLCTDLLPCLYQFMSWKHTSAPPP